MGEEVVGIRVEYVRGEGSGGFWGFLKMLWVLVLGGSCIDKF